MIYTFDYDMSYSPSMPVVEVAIRQEHHAPGVTLRAIVDSGADATMIPVKLLTQIGASIGDRVWLRGTTQDRIQVDLYWIWLQIGGHPPLYLDVIGDRVGGEAILGRDVLNQLIVTLNGLAATVEISD